MAAMATAQAAAPVLALRPHSSQFHLVPMPSGSALPGRACATGALRAKATSRAQQARCEDIGSQATALRGTASLASAAVALATDAPLAITLLSLGSAAAAAAAAAAAGGAATTGAADTALQEMSDNKSVCDVLSDDTDGLGAELSWQRSAPARCACYYVRIVTRSAVLADGGQSADASLVCACLARGSCTAATFEWDAPPLSEAVVMRGARPPVASRTTGARRSHRASAVFATSGGMASRLDGGAVEAATPTAAEGAEALTALLTHSRANGLPPMRLVFNASTGGAANDADGSPDTAVTACGAAVRDDDDGTAGASASVYVRKDHSLRSLCQVRAATVMRCACSISELLVGVLAADAPIPSQRFFAMYAQAAQPVSIAHAADQLNVKARRIYGARCKEKRPLCFRSAF